MINICPKCGKPALHKPTRFTNGALHYIHSQAEFLVPFKHTIIIESCIWLKAEQIIFEQNETMQDD